MHNPEVNLDLESEILEKLLVNLEHGIQKGLFNNQSSGIAAHTIQIIFLLD